MIPQTMPPAVCKLDFGLPRSDDHIQFFFEKHVDHGSGSIGVVGRVTIAKHIHICFRVSEHASNDVAFSLHSFSKYEGAMGSRNLHGRIMAIVVINIDSCVG